MRLLLTRPAEDAKASAAALKEMGHEVEIAPLLQIEPLPAEVDLAPYQAVLITSANGVRALAEKTDDRTTPLICVGEASAKEATSLGFQNVSHADGDVQALADKVAQTLKAEDGPLIHIAGENRAGDLKADLEARGFTVDRTALYRARLIEQLPALDWEKLDGALFYSPRTARHFVQLVEAQGVAHQCKTMVAYGLSPAVADALAALPFKAVKIAARPNQEALFDEISAPNERTDMSDSSTDTAPKPAPKNTVPNPAGANTGGSRLGWLVAGLVIALAAGAVGWGALYGNLPENMRANLPAFLQAPGESAGAELDAKMAAFDAELAMALSDIQVAAQNAEAQQGQRLTALENQLRAQSDANARITLKVETLQADIQSLKDANWVSPQDLEQLAAQLNDLEGAMVLYERSNLETGKRAEEAMALAEAAMNAGADAPRRTAFAVALSALDRAAATGRPFGGELAAAKTHADEDFALKLMPLSEYAPYGVDTLATLQDQFEPLARDAMKVDAIPADAPWYQKLWARLKSIVTIRPVGEVPGNTTGAILSRAEAQLGRGDLAEAVSTLDGLEGPAAVTFGKWLTRAQDRLALDEALADISLLAQTKSMGLVTQPKEPTPPELVEEDTL